MLRADDMQRFLVILTVLYVVNCSAAVHLDYLQYLDPAVLQTRTTPEVQQQAATRIINKYLSNVDVVVNPLLFTEHKDAFTIHTNGNQLVVRASSGVAAVWAAHHYLKKYCGAHIGWQVSRVYVPSPLPPADERVVANDRFRYYQNVCTASYSFVWWDSAQWVAHVEWMAVNGINLSLAPVAQEDAWARVYRRLGLTQDEIDEHMSGPAFLSWLRMGNMRGWAGPLPASWSARQTAVQTAVGRLMLDLGMVPVLPAFAGHVPRAFARVFPNTTFHDVTSWNKFDSDYCCGLFLEPTEPLFRRVALDFLQEVSAPLGTGHVYSADPFNEAVVSSWNDELVVNTAVAVFGAMRTFDPAAVWLLQNWMFVHDSNRWPHSLVQKFLRAVPLGRALVLDLQAEQWPQYERYDMYYGQPFVWCMLHNFGGTLGMFGDAATVARGAHDTRQVNGSTMIGVGLAPEGINQNYVMYDLMLESAWRERPVDNLTAWVEQYADRRYGVECEARGASAWRYLLRSVYSFSGLNKIRGKYVVTRRPSFKIRPWAWYRWQDLQRAWQHLLAAECTAASSDGYLHDVVDVTRQALQYRADQLYNDMLLQRRETTWGFNASIELFLDVMSDMERILATNKDFSAQDWLSKARSCAKDNSEIDLYELNARNQITLWGPRGEISDYACKQWTELFHHYYIPRWRVFLAAALDAKARKENFDERSAQMIVRTTVEEKFPLIEINPINGGDTMTIARELYRKWSNMQHLDELPITVIERDGGATTAADVVSDEDDDDDIHTVVMMRSTVAKRDIQPTTKYPSQ